MLKSIEQFQLNKIRQIVPNLVEPIYNEAFDVSLHLNFLCINFQEDQDISGEVDQLLRHIFDLNRFGGRRMNRELEANT